MSSTPEERLRQILLAEAEDLIPAGDGLGRIEQRLAARRSLRSKLLPAVALAGVAVVVGATFLTSLGHDDALRQSHQPAPSASAGTSAEPTPSPEPTALVTTSGEGVPVWPFTTDAEATSWLTDPGSRTWADDPVAVTQHLLDDYLELPGTSSRRLDSGSEVAVVEVSAAGRPVAEVRLVRVGVRAHKPWSVIGATSDDLSIQAPLAGELVASSMSVTGRVSGVDESVYVRLLTDRRLAEGHAPAGQEQPWVQPLHWQWGSREVAALVASTYDGKGDLHAVALTPVRRAPELAGPAAADTFVAVQNGRVYAVDATTGQPRRPVSFPPSGAIDSDPDRGGEDVVWARTKADGCSSMLVRAGVAGGTASIPVGFAPRRRRLPALSAHGTSLAWVEQPCDGGMPSVVVRGADGHDASVEVGEDVVDLDVRDDGTALVELADRLVSLPPGARTMTAGTQLRVEPGCVLQGPAWNDQTGMGWQRCGDAWQIVTWVKSSAVGQATKFVDFPADVVHTAVAEGTLLMSLTDGRIVRLAEGHVVELPNANKWSTPDW